MGKNQCEFLIKAEGSQGAVSQQVYDADDYLHVRDLSTRMTVHIRAMEISPYRHTLLLNGRAYQILTVIRPH